LLATAAELKVKLLNPTNQGTVHLTFLPKTC